MRLYPDLLRTAYSQGYFPMPNPDSGEILWCRPDPRAILPIESYRPSRSLARKIRNGRFQISFDQAFPDVMRGCANRKETWITDEFISVYTAIFQEGWGHSVDVWQNGKLVGGLYGIALGAAFFAESMFHEATDASKVGLFHLVERLRENGFELFEVQFLTPHLVSLGAVEIPDLQYQTRLHKALRKEVKLNIAKENRILKGFRRIRAAPPNGQKAS